MRERHYNEPAAEWRLVSELIKDDQLVERIEKLAWERDIPEQRVLQRCCWYGVLNYEEVLTVR